MLTQELRPQNLSQMVGNELNKEMLRAIARNPDITPSTLMFQGAFGSGKSLTGDSVIRTTSGLRLLGDLFNTTVGDDVQLSSPYEALLDGTSHPFSRGHHSGLCRGKYIHLRSGRVLRCSNTHPLLVWNDHSHNFEWREAQTLGTGDTLVHDLTPVALTEAPSDEWYIIGVLVGKAHILPGSINIYLEDPELRALVRNTLIRCHSFDETSTTVLKVKMYSPIWDLAESESMIPQSFRDNWVPRNLFRIPMSDQIAFVQGVMDTCAVLDERGHCELSHPSYSIIAKLVHIFDAYGIETTVFHKTTYNLSEGSIVFTQDVRLKDLFRLESKKSRISYSRVTEPVPTLPGLQEELDKLKSSLPSLPPELDKPTNLYTYGNLIKFKELCSASNLPTTLIHPLWIGEDIISIEDLDKEYEMYDLYIPGVNAYISNSYVSHNCVLGDTHVLTSDGYKPISSLGPKEPGFTPYEGPKVWTTSGWVKPSHFYYEKDVPTISLETASGNKLTGTPNHSILISDNDLNLGFAPLATLRVGHIILTSHSLMKQSTASPSIEAWREAEIAGNRIPKDLNEQSEDFKASYIASRVHREGKSLMTHSKEECELLCRVLESLCIGYTVTPPEVILDPTTLMGILKIASQITDTEIQIRKPIWYMPITSILNLEHLYPRAWEQVKKFLHGNYFDYLSAIGVLSDWEEGAQLSSKLKNLLSFRQTTITKITKGKNDVYDLTVPGPHNFYANGFINHNTTSARIIAKAMNCKHFKNDLCGECDVCKSDIQSTPFYTEYDASAMGNVEAVRALRDTFHYTVPGRVRTIVIDEIQEASRQAQGALLKEFEEAPQGVKFVLCVAEGTLIQTDKGLVPIEDITTEKVATALGYMNLLGKYDQGIQDTLVLTTESGFSLRATPNHRVKVATPQGLVWKRMDELTTEDYLPLFQGTHHTKSPLNLYECELLGWIVGKGVVHKNQIRVEVNHTVLSRFLRLIEIAGHGVSYKEEKNAQCTHIYLSTKEGNLLSIFGIEDLHNHLPKQVFQMDEEQFNRFAYGWWEACGSKKSKASLIVSSNSKTIIDEYQQLSLLYGYRVVINEPNERPIYTRRASPGHTFQFPNWQETREYLISKGEGYLSRHSGYTGRYSINRKSVYKHLDLSFRGPYIYDRVKSIIQAGPTHTWDLEVEDVHEYITNGFISHNCTTHPDRVLPTIRSRALELRFDTQSPQQVKDNIFQVSERIGIPVQEDVADLIAVRSRGHMRDAHMLLDQYRLMGRDAFLQTIRSSKLDILRLLVQLKRRDKDKYFRAVDQLLTHPLAHLVEDYQRTLLDLLKVQMGVIQGDEMLRKVASFYGNDTLKLVRICTASWVLDSFTNDVTLQTALLALYQQLEPASQQPSTTVNRNMK